MNNARPGRTILMLATYGLEIVEVGGTLAKHARRGDSVFALVALARPDAEPQIARAADRLGVRETRFLRYPRSEVQVDTPSKQSVVRLLREWRPDTAIFMDPEHANHDLDPDRRLISLIFLEALSSAGRDVWLDACGGHAPHHVHHLYYMTPDRPNCVVDITETASVKAEALAELRYQHEFSAQSLRNRLGDAALDALLPDWRERDPAYLGLALQREMDRALHLYHGLLSHTGPALAEPFRHEGPFSLDHLI